MSNYIGNILVACEYSGTVRDAFENLGWYAISVDLLQTESKQTMLSGKHYVGNILDFIKKDELIKWTHLNERIRNNQPAFDMLIAFPPCTYFSFVYTGKIYKMKDIIGNALTSYTKNEPFEYDVQWQIIVAIDVAVFVILLSLTPYFKRL